LVIVTRETIEWKFEGHLERNSEFRKIPFDQFDPKFKQQGFKVLKIN